MSKSYHLTVGFLSLVLLLTACESDADKLQRLNGDRAVNCLLAQKYQREYELAEAPKSPPNLPLKDSLFREYMDYNTKCELATRDLNRFMR